MKNILKNYKMPIILFILLIPLSFFMFLTTMNVFSLEYAEQVVYNKHYLNPIMSALNSYQLLFFMFFVALSYFVIREYPKKIFKPVILLAVFFVLQIYTLKIFTPEIKDHYIKLDYGFVDSAIKANVGTENISTPLYIEFKKNMENNNEHYLVEFFKNNNMQHFIYVNKDKVDEVVLLNKVTSDQGYKDFFNKIYVNGKITQYDYDSFINYLSKTDNKT